MELENEELFTAFLTHYLKDAAFDADAYLEQLIIHWGETGETTFTLNPEETASGLAETIPFSVKTRYFIRENGAEVPVDDPDEGFDTYRPVLCFTTAEAVETPAPAEPVPHSALNPLTLIRHRAGRTRRTLALLSGVSEETLERYEQPGFDLGQLPLATADAIAKALNVHAEDLLSCAPTAPRNLR